MRSDGDQPNIWTKDRWAAFAITCSIHLQAGPDHLYVLDEDSHIVTGDSNGYAAITRFVSMTGLMVQEGDQWRLVAAGFGVYRATVGDRVVERGAYQRVNSKT